MYIRALYKHLIFTSNYSKTYHRYLSSHIVSIIDSKPELSSRCVPHLNQVIMKHQINQQQIRSKLNMIYNVHCLPEPLSNHREKLVQGIKQSKICNQSELDRILQKLNKNLKYDRNINIQQIISMGKQTQNCAEEFQVEIMKLQNQDLSKRNIPNLCKQFRAKFFAIDSKIIYSRIKKLFQKKLERFPSNCLQQKKPKQQNIHHFWDKMYNIKPRLLADECNDPQIYQQHLQLTKGQLRFRFPPQPNGYLHIGHVKAMRINFETAKRYNGTCFLRYDDTNPETQSHEYIDNILANIKWLGYRPDKITFASDYFEEMIQFAIKLIKEGNAYVCDSPQAEIQDQRLHKRKNSYRDRPVEQSLKCFPNLKDGQTLRLKLSHDAPNPTLRDPVIYRIKNKPHPRTGQKFKIYPMYDFAHCICDSLEHIDYSLCSLQFEVRRQLYYKILELLKLYKPNVWQYSRLNVQSALISKRKIKSLIDSNKINDWSDPRLLTIGGLINRGYTPSMLINFIDKVNSSRSGNQNVVQYSLLQRQMKKQLFKKAMKYMMVLQPKQAFISGQQIQTVQIPIFPENQEKKRKLTITSKIYIEQSQSLQEIQFVILKYLGVFRIVSKQPTIIFKKQQITISAFKEQQKKYKVIHWISDADSEQYPVTCFNRLLDQKGEVKNDSKLIYTNSMLPKEVIALKQEQAKYWQMERLGYFKYCGDQFIRCVSI